MKITLKTSVLRAALICAAKKDLRYYLQGVCISINGPDVAMVYGTDGHILFAGQCPIVCHVAPENDKPSFYPFHEVILFPSTFTPSDIFNHPFTKGRTGKLIAN